MGEIFGRGYAGESLRVRRIIHDHFALNGTLVFPHITCFSVVVNVLRPGIRCLNDAVNQSCVFMSYTIHVLFSCKTLGFRFSSLVSREYGEAISIEIRNVRNWALLLKHPQHRHNYGRSDGRNFFLYNKKNHPYNEKKIWKVWLNFWILS